MLPPLRWYASGGVAEGSLSVAWRAMDGPLQLGRGVRDPALRGRAAHEPLVRAGRSARQRDRLARRGGLRRGRVASRSPSSRSSASRRAWARWSGRRRRTRAARRATASWPCSACARGWPSALVVQRPRRPTKPTAAARRKRMTPSDATASASRRGGGRSRRVRVALPRASWARPRRRPRRPAARSASASGPCRRPALAGRRRRDGPTVRRGGRHRRRLVVCGVGRVRVGLVGVRPVAEVVGRGRTPRSAGVVLGSLSPPAVAITTIRTSRTHGGRSRGHHVGGACRRSPARADQGLRGGPPGGARPSIETACGLVVQRAQGSGSAQGG